MSGIRRFDTHHRPGQFPKRRDWSREYAHTGRCDHRGMPTTRIGLEVFTTAQRFRPATFALHWYATQVHTYELREQTGGHFMIYKDGVPIAPVSTIDDANRWLTREVRLCLDPDYTDATTAEPSSRRRN